MKTFSKPESFVRNHKAPISHNKSLIHGFNVHCAPCKRTLNQVQERHINADTLYINICKLLFMAYDIPLTLTLNSVNTRGYGEMHAKT